MSKTSPLVKFLINLAKTQTILNSRFDRGLGGLGFNEFLILHSLSQADNQTMRRVDIADKIGMTASGVTRLLLPMEKVHLIKSGPNEQDARVRCVLLASGGKQRLFEALERMELLSEEIIMPNQLDKISELSDLVVEIGGRALMV
ncbi:MAG: MarR family transcriptional regulator [Candidatus Magasanikbacteria bacterium CG10_big_fil_rev_8_21_14_0_10_36_32]|uniref:MarR family transcriptional regulator n=1 Tax=Candidatus Magasanikbacteria bacterium CG10_big_fil_rev_8_21_14_0_10_36_32 TaxID=1974646 RepID=A0A2M6W5C6_9BACT|nr:MAG: MarR family transcriptional regulator [Candidatus Magasanikbacteria bacterium CG10_big_fil_rev_8_21_14_0_10_36_32]